MARVYGTHQSASVSHLMRIGTMAMRRGDHRAARAAFLGAHAEDATCAEVCNKLAALYHKSEEPEQCILWAEKTLATNTRHFGALAGLAVSLSVLGP